MHHDDLRPDAVAGLVPLGELGGRRLADGEPDLRGWEVRASSGDVLGVVADLLVDTAAGEIAALAVVPPEHARTIERWRDGAHVVLPVEQVDIDASRRAVVPDAIGRARLYALERGAAPAFDLADQGSLRSAPAMGTPPRDAPLPSTVHAAPRPADADVTIERTADGEEVVRVPIVEERLVVQPVVTDVLVIRKRAVADSRVVEADLRRERLDVHDTTRDGAARVVDRGEDGGAADRRR